MKISVITIVKDRENHLLNLIKALEQSYTTPYELIIVRMNEPNRFIWSSLNILQHSLNEKGLPLAKARNIGATLAQGELLIYLDVDCIPSYNMLDYYYQGMQYSVGNCILMGQVRYLPKDAVPHHWDGDLGQLHSLGEYHPLRPRVKSIRPELKYELFWSLAFAISKEQYEALGGFDTHYTGWGGEDTDFAFTAREAGILLYWSMATCFHQYHPPNDNPEWYLESIVTNANYFYSKWGIYPMKTFLDYFENQGLIALSPRGYKIL